MASACSVVSGLWLVSCVVDSSVVEDFGSVSESAVGSLESVEVVSAVVAVLSESDDPVCVVVSPDYSVSWRGTGVCVSDAEDCS